MTDIVIIGNAIAADIVYGYLKTDNRYNVLAFSVDKEYIDNDEKFGLPVVDFNSIQDQYDVNNVKVMLGIGYGNMNQNRADFFKKVKEKGYTVETYIHPTAVVHEETQIGEGAMVLSNSVVEPFAKIGEDSLVWSNCTIAHHSSLGDHCWVASNSILSGSAIVKNFTFIGVQCTIVNEVVIEELNLIGGGCLITKSTKPKEVYLSRNSEKHRFDSINYSKFFLK